MKRISLWLLSLILFAGVALSLPKYKSFEKLVATAGTRVPLAASKLLSSHVLIKARSNNSGIVYVGGSDVAAANGYHLAANAEVNLRDLMRNGSDEQFDLAAVYLDAASSGDGVRVIYVYDRYTP